MPKVLGDEELEVGLLHLYWNCLDARLWAVPQVMGQKASWEEAGMTGAVEMK